MKVTNIILSIVILLLAIALAVSSFFLYEKREIMLSGWEKLTTTVNETAKEMDKNSGTKLAESLTQDELHHTNYANLEDKLKALNEGAAKLIQQRDNLARTLSNVARVLEASNAPGTEDLTKINSSADAAKKVAAQANEFKARRDAAYNSLLKSGRLLGISINVNDLKKGNSKKVFDAVDKRINELQNQLRRYEATSREIGRIAGKNLTFNASNYASSLVQLKNAVQDLRNKLQVTESNLKGAKNEIAELKGKVDNQNKNIKELNTTVSKKDAEIKNYRRALNLDPVEVINPWNDGSKEARLAVRGKIIEINKKFGFCVINLGNNTLVEQRIGNRINKINPQIESNMIVTIARNIDNADIKDDEYISKGKITNVADDCAIIEDISNDKPIKVGDDIYFAEKDLK
ncbi:MAG: hypothetical protein IKA22_02130 [Lentisphaeria bacterium]|nr:hypothetical protein [Lentisphaeria bacterium]